MSQDKKQRSTHHRAAQSNPENGTEPTDESVERQVGARTPERVEQEQVRNKGVEGNTSEGGVPPPELAPKQRTGGPAELDHVPLDET